MQYTDDTSDFVDVRIIGSLSQCQTNIKYWFLIFSRVRKGYGCNKCCISENFRNIIMLSSKVVHRNIHLIYSLCIQIILFVLRTSPRTEIYFFSKMPIYLSDNAFTNPQLSKLRMLEMIAPSLVNIEIVPGLRYKQIILC